MEQPSPIDEPFWQLFRALSLILNLAAQQDDISQKLSRCREDTVCTYRKMLIHAPANHKRLGTLFLLANYGNTAYVESEGRLFEAQLCSVDPISKEDVCLTFKTRALLDIVKRMKLEEASKIKFAPNERAKPRVSASAKRKRSSPSEQSPGKRQRLGQNEVGEFLVLCYWYPFDRFISHHF